MELRKSQEPLPGLAVPLILLLFVSGSRTETARYSVPEKAERGFFVANIAKDLGLTREELSARQARLVSEGEKQYLQLNQHTGDLVVRERMDREELCGQSEPCLVRFEVLLESPLQSFRAEVSLTDINDHAPVFLNTEIVLKIPETAMPEARFLLESAQDADVGNNSLQHYNISSNDYFHIHTRRRSDGRRYAELVLDRGLDREQQAEVTFSVTAVDGGSPPLSGTALIRVVVLDINDNIPEFTRILYKARVLENSSQDTLVVVVSASDLDAGTNGEISYSIVQNSEENLQTFKINSETGQIRLKKPVDYEETKSYEIDVQATDGGGLSAHCKVEVQVEDVNDNAPEVIITSVTSTLSEAAPPNTVVALFNVRDRDWGENGRTSCEMADEQPFSIAPLAADAYALVTSEGLDREEVSEYNVTLRARDEGSPALSTSKTLLVRLLDVNDNAPMFTQEVYTMVLKENEPAGTILGRLRATDADAGKNAHVRYALGAAPPGIPSAASFVSVDPESRIVRALLALDYEEMRGLEVAVRAADGGSPPLSAQAVLRVVVRDENDNAPVVLHPPPGSSSSSSSSSSSAAAGELVWRGAAAGELVAKVVAVDRDAGANGKISCALEDQLSFSLRPAYENYYELVTVSPLDREEVARYILTITAADTGSPPLTTTQTFTVDISDVNDNAPVFNQTSYTMYVRENNVPTALVGAVSASDADVGPNAKVTYFLTPMHPTGRPSCSCISVNSENGHVFVLQPLDYEQVRHIEALVTASDAGSPPLSANVTVRLVVVDENDNAPLVLHPGQDSSPLSSELVPMSAETGYLVTKVVAVDADSGQNSWLSYHLLRATDPGLFVVGAQSGEVRLKRPVTERDTVKQKLVVLVRDNGRPPLSATAALSAVLLNDFSDVHLPPHLGMEEEEGGSLTTYLIISLVFVSLLFLASMAAFVVRKVCKGKDLKGGHVLYGAGDLQSGLGDAAATGTLPHAYCYEISLTTGSGNSEFKFLKPILPSLPPQHSAMSRGTNQEFPPDPVAVGDRAPDNPGTLFAEQFNSLSFN